MQKCQTCGFRRTQVQEIRNPETGQVIGSRTVCTNCQSVIHEHYHQR